MPSLEEQVANLSPETRESFEIAKKLIRDSPIVALDFARLVYMNDGESPESVHDLWASGGLYLAALTKIIQEQQKQIDKLSEQVYGIKPA